MGAPLDPTSPNGADAAHDDAETETIGIPYAATRPHASHLPAVIVDAYDLNYSSVDRRRAREAALPALNIGAERGAPARARAAREERRRHPRHARHGGAQESGPHLARGRVAERADG